jgi:arylsulfatase A-like enzyme
VTADHGEEFGDHGAAFHNLTLYDEILRVPLFLRAPGGAVTGRVALPTSAIDVAPTLLALAGVPREGGFAPGGANLFTVPPDRPQLAARFQVPRSFYFAGETAIVLGRWKLLYGLAFDSAALYDLSADPGERENLVDTHPDVAAALARRLAAAFAAR